MKKKIIFSIILLIFICLPLNVRAAYDAYINDSSVRIRKGPGTDKGIIATLNTNTSISVVDKTLYTGAGCSAKWYKITYKDETAYVCSTYVSFVNTSYAGINVIDWTARVNSNNVTVRSNAGTNYSSKGSLTLGANVSIMSTKKGGTSGCSGGKWYQIKYYGDSTGYICSNYVTTKSSVSASDTEYEKVLSAAGFPSSYFPYLTYLHKKYPNWIFKAGNTKINFATAVSSETGKNYMQTKNDNYRTSSVPSEGKTWFNVNKGVIAFYLDPRNWLTEERIFMFEKLDYDSTLESQYPSLIKSIFGSGILADDKYTVPMFNAGKTKKISPVLIATRIRLEVGADGSASTSGGKFTWKGKEYSGFYNFLNIGAYEVTVDGVSYSAVTRGLAYAGKLISRDGSVWDNVETSITEGSNLLADGYVTKGQGTLYYQKFNVGPDAYYSSFTHQYMTNIQAPATEGNQSYNSYKGAKILSQTSIFEIPVYNNMPDYTSLPNSGDTNNELSSLEVSGYSITPSFDEDIITYEAYVPKGTEKVTIKATTASNLSSISGTGEIILKSDENEITVVVTSQSGEDKTYTITIHRVENTTNVLKSLSNVAATINGNYLTNIKNSTVANTISNQIIKNGALNVTIKDKNSKVVSDGAILSTGYTMTIVTSIDTKTYTLSIKGDTSGDGKVTILDLLQVQKHILKDKSLTGAYLLSADTSGDGKVTILDLLQVQKHILGDKKL